MSKRELADRQKQPEPNDIPVKNAKGERMNVLDQIERKRKEQFEQVMHRETVQDEYIVPKQPEPNDSRPILDLVIEDMRERDHIGRERYGTPLQAHNGRDAMVDAYQEALDLVAYLRQVIEERSDLREQRDRLKKVIAILEDDVAKVTSDRDQAIAETVERCAQACEETARIWQYSPERSAGARMSADRIRSKFVHVAQREQPSAESADREAAASATTCDSSAEGASQLPARILAMCKARGWGLHWTHRGAYLHLEASELFEAIRGKHGDPKEEAGDVLLVLMSITEANGISWDDVVASAGAKVDKLISDLAPCPGDERGE